MRAFRFLQLEEEVPVSFCSTKDAVDRGDAEGVVCAENQILQYL